jgi:16S rRNA (guanine(966)-N(2))-methyltransferase RsmD
VRILGGKAKGRKISTLSTKGSRPTLQVVRKSIFDVLGYDVQEAQVLDLYSGTGSLGLEALSRGGYEATFVDENQRALDVVRENAEELGFEEKIHLVKGDAARMLPKLARNGMSYHIVFADPPYQRSLTSEMIEAFGVSGIVRNGGSFIIEHSKHAELPDRIGRLVLWQRKDFGETRVSFYRKEKELS